LTAAQPQLVNGVHLPNIMRLAGPTIIAGGASSGRRRRLLGLPKPTLQRSLAGTVIVALLSEQNTNQAAAPHRMPLPHFHGFLENHRVGWRLLGRTTIIVGSKPFLAALGKSTYQMPHGAHR
jgi:hypothetical protein